MEVIVVGSDQIDAMTRLDLRALWNRAFGDRFSDCDADHAYGGVHVLSRDGDRLISHASAVARRIRFGDEPWRTVGYVEAVAVDPVPGRRYWSSNNGEAPGGDFVSLACCVAFDRTGHGVLRVARLGALAGALVYPDCREGRSRREHGGLMVLRLDPAVVPDLSVAVTCEDRPGDAW